MRMINVGGRAHVATATGSVDVAEASAGAFGPDPQALFDDWAAFAAWAGTVDPTAGSAVDETTLLAPVPAPRQVFAVGLNYRDHAAEAGLGVPDGVPAVFTKFGSALTGPVGDLVLSGGSVDWEVELVAVIGAEAHAVRAAEALRYVAGVTIGQDFSDREVQLAGPAPQFSLGKSFPGFGPTGPALVTLDEIADLDALRLRCWIDDELVQEGTVGQMVYPLPTLIERLSAVCTLQPGDLVFTGTPAGVGMARTPPRYLKRGEVVRTEITALGSMEHRCR